MKFKTNYRLLLGKVLFFSVLFAQVVDALTIETFLQSMPPQTMNESKALFEQALHENDLFLLSLCERILPAEQGVDAASHYALYGLSQYVMQPDKTAERLRVNRVLEISLIRAHHPEVQRFFMSLLGLCGDRVTLKVLEPYVCDPVVYDDAVRTIASIGGFAAVSMLFTLQCPEDSENKDASIQNALALFGGELEDLARTTGLPRVLLTAIVAPEGIENQVYVAQLCREALQNKDLKPHYRAMVLRFLVHLDHDAALPELLQAASSSEPILWGMALHLAGKLEGEAVSEAWVSILTQVDEAVKPQVIFMLGKRRDDTAQQAIRNAMRDPSWEVRRAAYETITKESGHAFLNDLLEAMGRADEQREVKAIKSSLLRIPQLEEAVWGEISGDWNAVLSLPTAQKRAYLDILADRKATRFAPMAARLAVDENVQVRQSAYATLASVGETEHAELLFEQLLREEDTSAADSARDALAKVTHRLGLEAMVIDKIKHALSTQSNEQIIRLAKTLRDVGSPEAFDTFRQMVEQAVFAKPQDQEQSSALLDILARWQTSEGEALLVSLWQRLEEETLRMEALKQCIVSIQRNYPDPEKQHEHLFALEEKCTTDSERQLVSEALVKSAITGLK